MFSPSHQNMLTTTGRPSDITLNGSNVRQVWSWLQRSGRIFAEGSKPYGLQTQGSRLPRFSRPQKAGAATSSGRLAQNRKKRSEEHTSELQSQFHLVCRL